MEGTILLFLLCMQAGLLANSLDCAEGGRSRRVDGTACGGPKATEETAKVLASPHQAPSGPFWATSHVQPVRLQRARRQIDYHSKKKKPLRMGSFSTSNVTWNPEWLKATATSGTKSHLDKASGQHKAPSYNGIMTETGQSEQPFPMEWERRNQAALKKKPRRKPRVGSFSLLSNKQDVPPKITRVRRQLTSRKKKQPGKESTVGHPEVKSKRNMPTKRNSKGIIC